MNLDCFIAQYSSEENQSQIAFAPNSEVGAKLFDQNAQHRRSVAKLIIESPTLASDPLIRDLYDAETQYSKASFSVYHEFVSMLAKELLTRGGEKNLSCFLHCVMRAQDSYFSSVSVTLDRSSAASVVAFIDSQISKLGENSPKHYAMVRANIERQIGE